MKKNNFKFIGHKKSKIPQCSTCNGIKELEEREEKEMEKLYKEFNINIYDVYPADQCKLNTLAREIIRLKEYIKIKNL